MVYVITEKFYSQEDSEPQAKKRGSTGKKPAAKKAKKTSDDSASEGSEGESEEEYSPKKAKPGKARKLPPKKKKGSESDSDEDWGKKKGGKKGVRYFALLLVNITQLTNFRVAQNEQVVAVTQKPSNSPQSWLH